LGAISIFLANISHSGVWFSDAASHALNGAFYKDMLEEKGFLNPVEYAERYYVQYPSLTIGMYPPVFYLVEALSYKIFGVSSEASKFAVLLFTIAGAYGFFLLCRLWFPVWLSVVGSLVYLLQPTTLFAEKNVMLEMPMVAASLIALYYLCSLMEDHKKVALFMAPFFTAVAFLVRQGAVFLLLVWATSILCYRKWGIFKSPCFIAGVLTGTIILAPWIAVNLTVGRGHVAILDFQVSHIFPNVLFYCQHALDIVSFPVILLSIGSLFAFKRLSREKSFRLAILVILSVVPFLFPMKYRDPRYAICLVPAFIILSLEVLWLFAQNLSRIFPQRVVCWVLAVLIILLHYNPNTVWGSPDIQGFGKVADLVVNDQDCVAVLYDGYYNERFIYEMRVRDEDRRVFVFRASKVVFSTKILVDVGYNELVKDYSAFLDLLRRYAIKYVVQEERSLVNTPANRNIREWVQRPEFRLTGQYSIPHSGLSGFGKLLVYEYLDYTGGEIREIELDMPVLGRKIKVSVGKKGQS
jgi:4-amino-4-deoxy-L-arabinose transferase-like glycosyltransferase